VSEALTGAVCKQFVFFACKAPMANSKLPVDNREWVATVLCHQLSGAVCRHRCL